MRQINLELNEDAQIFVNGKLIMSIEQVSDDTCVDCFVYAQKWSKPIPELEATGCVGEIII